MAEQPHLVLEGLLLGMVVTGAREGWVFIRHEYGPGGGAAARGDRARAGVGARRGRAAVVALEIFTSPGGYILGEESALLECMEGHRGEPRNKPPFPGVYGLWGKPTLMNSVETFAHVPVILERGADWWKAQGANGSTGLKFFAVSGHVERPGVYCVPMGTTGRELLELAGGVRERRGARGDPAGRRVLELPRTRTASTCRSTSAPLAEAGSMLGSGALVVIAEGTDLLAAATNVLRFFRNESCGKCVPCRVGSHKAHEMLTELLESGGGPDDVDERHRPARGDDAAHLDLRPGPGGARAVLSVVGLERGGTGARPPAYPRSCIGGAEPPPRGTRVLRGAHGLRGTRGIPARRGARASSGRAGERARAHPGRADPAPARRSRLRARHRRRLRGPRRGHVRRLRGAP